MARARNIKPGFFTNEELVELPFATRLLFIGLWTVADRAGRLEDKPKRIKMNLFPADDFDIDQALTDLQGRGFLLRYEHEGQRFIQIISFGKHQNPHKDEKQSTIPAPFEHGASTVQDSKEHGGNPADSLIPDSPIPDTGFLKAEASPEPAEKSAARSITAGDLSIAMRSGGVKSQPADPRLIALAEQGVLPETVSAACEEAKRSKPNEQIGPGYVFKILERWAADAAALKVAGAAQPRAGPPGYKTANDKAKDLADRLTGKKRHEPDRNIIDINEPPS